MIERILQKIRGNVKIKQVAGLLSVNVISIPLSVITSIIITRFLGSDRLREFQIYIKSVFSGHCDLYLWILSGRKQGPCIKC